MEALVNKLKTSQKYYESLVIIEHDNETVKQSSFSTISAKEISDSVEAIVLGQGLVQ